MGITHSEHKSRLDEHRPGPECGKTGPRDRVRTRTRPDRGDPVGGRPREIRLTYSPHPCTRCRPDFTADMPDRGRAQGPLHPSGRGFGRPAGGGGRLTRSDRQLAPRARPRSSSELIHRPDEPAGVPFPVNLAILEKNSTLGLSVRHRRSDIEDSAKSVKRNWRPLWMTATTKSMIDKRRSISVERTQGPLSMIATTA